MVHLIEQLQMSKTAFLPDFSCLYMAYLSFSNLSLWAVLEQFLPFPRCLFLRLPTLYGCWGCPGDVPLHRVCGVILSLSQQLQVLMVPLCYLNPVSCARTRSTDVAVLAAGHCRNQGTNPVMILTPSQGVFSDVLCIIWMNPPKAESTFLPQHTFSRGFEVSLGLTSSYLSST